MNIHTDAKPRNNRVLYLDEAAGQLVEYQTTPDARRYLLNRDGLVIGWERVASPPRGDGWECAVRTPDHRTIWTRASYLPRQEMAVVS